MQQRRSQGNQFFVILSFSLLFDHQNRAIWRGSEQLHFRDDLWTVSTLLNACFDAPWRTYKFGSDLQTSDRRDDDDELPLMEILFFNSNSFLRGCWFHKHYYQVWLTNYAIIKLHIILLQTGSYIWLIRDQSIDDWFFFSTNLAMSPSQWTFRRVQEMHLSVV